MPREPECSITQTRPVGVQADLDEVVAAAERAHLVQRLRRVRLHRRGQVLEAAPERGPVARVAVGERRGLVLGEPDRHRTLHIGPQAAQVVRQVHGTQRGTDGGHAAADVHPDGGGRDRVAHGDDRADRGALAVVHVRHHRHVLERPRQRGDVVELPHGLGLDRVGAGPQADVHVPPGDRRRSHDLQARCRRRGRHSIRSGAPFATGASTGRRSCRPRLGTRRPSRPSIAGSRGGAGSPAPPRAPASGRGRPPGTRRGAP